MSAINRTAAIAVVALLAGCGDSNGRSSPTAQREPPSPESVSGSTGVMVARLAISDEEVRRHVPGSAAAAIAALQDTIVAMAPDSTKAVTRKLVTDTMIEISWTPQPAEARLLAELYRLRGLERRAEWLAGERRNAMTRPLRIGIFVDSVLDRSVAAATLLKERAQLGAWIALPRDATPTDLAIAMSALRTVRRERGDLARRDERIPVSAPSVLPTLSREDEARYSTWLKQLSSARVSNDRPGYSPRRVLFVQLGR